MVDRAFLGVAEDEAAAERAFVAPPKRGLVLPHHRIRFGQ